MTNLIINVPLTRQILTGFISSEMRRAGFSRGVIGLSGGIDSALSCFLAAEALGPENVLAVRMPYKASSPDSLAHAQLLIEATGVQSLTIPITAMVDPLFDRFPEAGALRRGNVMARARMTILYDQSAACDGLVVGTGNKTEILLGYTTLYGDSACAFNPIGDMYKTQVRQLSRAVGLPSVIIDKPPSADLWTGQTDEDELGFTYEEVDKLLYLLIDQHCTPEDCVEAGFSDVFVRQVVERVRGSQFKRVMPPIARLTNFTA
ncbi:MAG: NAD+ synthase [Chloroflexi bacterium]|nr:NAD+ synthase [Chloroflexota bacterium]MBU1662528.1 NAD+ synthase [Chloroflexota bacterium]